LSASLLVRNISELVTNDPARDGLLGIVPDAAVAVIDGTVAWVGSSGEVPERHSRLPVLDAERSAVLPGFVDAHTHLVFAGDRADEFARRLGGARYEDILAAGGGILSTVQATRAAGREALLESALARAERMLEAGTTTVEVKSGYGLDVATEVEILVVAATIAREIPIDVVPTFLGAHAVPSEYRDRRSDYVSLVAGPMMEAAAPHSVFADVFCDEGAFTVDEARIIAESARSRGLGVRMHVEQLARTGGAALAAELGAASADHLDNADDEDLAALRAAGTAAVLLPAVSFSMHLPYPDGRRIWDSGVTVALGTDCNPGTAYVETMPFVVTLAVLGMGLTPEEAVWAATRGSARSLLLDDRGWLGPGARADLVLLDAPSHRHIPYRPDGDLVARVVAGGQVVA
jgi:imidazolonepropionase